MRLLRESSPCPKNPLRNKRKRNKIASKLTEALLLSSYLLSELPCQYLGFKRLPTQCWKISSIDLFWTYRSCSFKRSYWVMFSFDFASCFYGSIPHRYGGLTSIAPWIHIMLLYCFLLAIFLFTINGFFTDRHSYFICRISWRQVDMLNFLGLSVQIM